MSILIAEQMAEIAISAARVVGFLVLIQKLLFYLIQLLVNLHSRTKHIRDAVEILKKESRF